jgi:hypothetical protein
MYMSQCKEYPDTTERRRKEQEIRGENGQGYKLIVTEMHGLSSILVYRSLRCVTVVLKVGKLYIVEQFGLFVMNLAVFFLAYFRELPQLHVRHAVA